MGWSSQKHRAGNMSREIHLGSNVFGCSIDVMHGARLSSLRMAASERLVARTTGATATSWGAYPMVPFAGRVRHGRFVHDGVQHTLPVNMPPHAIHGTVFGSAWATVERAATHAVFSTSLGARWPYPAIVTHEVSVDSAQRTITCVLTVMTTARSMPAQVGWHPWFVRPAVADVDFAEMYERDAEHIPTGRRTTPTSGPWDDCFTAARRSPRIVFDDGVALRIESDCDHWVVYDMPAHALCIEPQSGPPDGFNIAPQVITPDTPLRREMKLIAE